jgi:hypothetical protein
VVNYVTKEDSVQRLEQNCIIIYGGMASSLGISTLGIEPISRINKALKCAIGVLNEINQSYNVVN